MTVIDFIFLGLAIIAFIIGFSKGLIRIIINFIAIIIALYVSLNYSKYFLNFFSETFNLSMILSKFVSFLLIFIAVILIFKIISFALDSLISETKISFANKVAGGIFNVLKLIIVWSVLLSFLYEINKKHKIFNNNIFAGSFFSNKMILLGEKIISLQKNIKKEEKNEEIEKNSTENII